MKTDIQRLIASYPRVRRPLPPKLQEIYHETYLTSRDGKTFLHSISQRLEGWMHRQVARGSKPGQKVLEIGAGTLNQLRWEATSSEAGASQYDAVEPYRALYEGRPEAARIRAFYDDIDDVPLANRYDRIISIATLEHVLDPPRLVAEAAMRLTPRGIFAAGIPSEGGLLWGLSWRMSVGLSFRLRTGLNYGDLMRHEHVSRADEIRAVVSYFFRRCEVRRFPLPLRAAASTPPCGCEEPNLERCREILDLRANKR